MIHEHEIPKGSCLYFGKLAKDKRDLENKIVSFFYDENFEEIITPNFSYTQHQSIDNENELIKFNDENNNQVSLRADSTLDVARIITKRLGRTTAHKKWFYIQPVFSYPSNENYQIGLEWLEHNNSSEVINLCAKTFNQIGMKPLIQVTNINIAFLVAKHLNISIDLFKDGLVSKLFEQKIQWLDKLIYANSIEDLQNTLQELPNDIKIEVEKLINIAQDISYENITLSALYYAKMKYYEDLYFRVIQDNKIVARGGKYTSDGINSIGYALYTKEILEIKGNR
jgi:ATP phosphoribosyltransferase regulatory subunit HisZ